MKKILLLLLSTFVISFAQAQNTFEKAIDTLGSSYAYCVQQTFDGGYVVCGGSNAGGNDLIILKFDSAGTIEWAKTYGGPGMDGGVYLKQTPDSGYIVNGSYDSGLNSKSWLLRLNTIGDTLWTKTYSVGLGATDASQMAVNFSNNYGLTGYFHSSTQNPDAFLIITNDSGIVTSSNIYNTPFSSLVYGITSSNSNFIMTGQIGIALSSSNLYLIKTDSIGDTLWTRIYDNSQTGVGRSVDQTVEGGFIIAGLSWNNMTFKENGYLIKTNTYGDTLWTKTYGNATSVTFYNVNQTTDGGYIITGRIVNGNPLSSNIYLVKTDSLGNTLWTRQFGSIYEDDGYYVRQTKDGGYIISGLGATASAQGGLYLIKTDSMGLVNAGVGTAELNNPFVFNVYPNPTSGIFTLQLKGIPYNNATIEIYNLNHQCVYKSYATNHATLAIDLSDEGNGLYMVNLITKDNVFSKKIIIQK